MLLLIDNYDSFTHNLARYFSELGQQVKVVRNDQISLEDIASLAPQYLVFSPGPCTPDQAGITLAAIERFAGQIPIMGVCLAISHRSGVRSQCNTGQAGDAWKNLAGVSQWLGAVY